jgi:hypothetical protein
MKTSFDPVSGDHGAWEIQSARSSFFGGWQSAAVVTCVIVISAALGWYFGAVAH